jgi:hypothetical protein
MLVRRREIEFCLARVDRWPAYAEGHDHSEREDPVMESATSSICVLTDEPRTIDLRSGSARSDPRRSGSVDRLLRWGTTTLLLVIGLVHLHLWQDGYRTVPTIGPLFIVAAISAASIALVTSVQLNWLTATAATGFAAGTLVANILSLILARGLFEFKQIGVSYSGGIAIASEVGVLVLVSVWARNRLRSRRKPFGRRFGHRTRTVRCCSHR